MVVSHGAHAVAVEAGLWFAYGRSARPGVTARTTFDAVLRGERTSTTRFLRWPGHDAWKRLSPGDLVRFHERQDRTGRDLVVRALSVAPIDLRACDEDTLEAWSACEGWSREHGRARGRELGPALWIRHELVWPAAEAPPPVQLGLF